MIGYRKAVLAAAVAALPLSGAARAEERGALMRDTLSTLGLVERQQDPIDYRERAPLVMPPRIDGKALPAPRAAAAAPAWPVEPETVARQRELEERRQPRGSQISGRYNDNNATLGIDEMRAGRRADAHLTRPGDVRPTERESWWVNPLDLLRDRPEVVEPSEVEPTRYTLTEPPTGYRKAPRKLEKTAGDPIAPYNRDREEADPQAYLRSRR